MGEKGGGGGISKCKRLVESGIKKKRRTEEDRTIRKTLGGMGSDRMRRNKKELKVVKEGKVVVWLDVQKSRT